MLNGKKRPTPNTECVVIPNEVRDHAIALQITQFTVRDLGIDWEVLRFAQDDVPIERRELPRGR